MPATHLADTSAWAQLHRNDVAARLAPLFVGGGVATCRLVDLDLLATAMDATEHSQMEAERRCFPQVRIDDSVLDRAIEVQGRLPGRDIAPGALVVAAAAELGGLVLLHHDDAFDRIAAVTGQPMERVG